MKTDIRYKIDAYLRMAKTTTDENLRNLWCNKAAELLESYVDLKISQDSENVKLFADECLIVSNDGEFASNADIYSRYISFCVQNHFSCLSRVPFFTKLGELGFSILRCSKKIKNTRTVVRGYKVKLKTNEVNPNDE